MKYSLIYGIPREQRKPWRIVTSKSCSHYSCYLNGTYTLGLPEKSVRSLIT